MELYKIDNEIIINNSNKCLNILDDSNYSFWINGDENNKKLQGNSFVITEYDRMLYKTFSDFFNSLIDEYNAFKDFNDYEYENYPLYNEKYNWFTFYDDYSNIEEKNFLRIIKNESKEPYKIGIYIRNKNNKLQSHTIAKSGSKYPQFISCFEHLLLDLKKLEKEKAKPYIKRIEE